MHCDFHQKSIFGVSSVSARLRDAPTSSGATAGVLLTFGDGVAIDASRHVADSSEFHSILSGGSATLYCIVVTKSKV